MHKVTLDVIIFSYPPDIYIYTAIDSRVGLRIAWLGQNEQTFYALVFLRNTASEGDTLSYVKLVQEYVWSSSRLGTAVRSFI